MVARRERALARDPRRFRALSTYSGGAAKAWEVYRRLDRLLKELLGLR
jgi:hypothetical protein